MKVVIVGAGSVGSSIARELLAHKHEILLIDLKPEVIGRSGLRGAHWLVGDACELSTLQGYLRGSGRDLAYVQACGCFRYGKVTSRF